MNASAANVYLTIFVRVREFFSVSPIPPLDLFHEPSESDEAMDAAGDHEAEDPEWRIYMESLLWRPERSRF